MLLVQPIALYCLVHSLVEMGHHTLLDHFRSIAKYLGNLSVSQLHEVKFIFMHVVMTL
jgi:hypothetical protein